MTGEIKKEINAVTDSTTAEVTDKELSLSMRIHAES